MIPAAVAVTVQVPPEEGAVQAADATPLLVEVVKANAPVPGVVPAAGGSLRAPQEQEKTTLVPSGAGWLAFLTVAVMVDPPAVEVCGGEAEAVTAMAPDGTDPEEVEPPPLPHPAMSKRTKMMDRNPSLAC